MIYVISLLFLDLDFKRLPLSSMSKTITAADIAHALGGVQVARDEWKCRCPAHDDRNPSLWIKDGASGKLLAHCFTGCTQEAVILALTELKLWPESAGTFGESYASTALPKGISKVWPFSGALRKQGQEPGPENQKVLTRLFTYRDREPSKILGFTVRYDGHGAKDIVPYFNQEHGKWRTGHKAKTGRPLYGLDLIAKAEAEAREVTLIIVEGEKVADYLNARPISETGWFAMTWPGGSRSVKGADWTPLKDWWRIILSPDFDAAGFRAMADVAEHLKAAGFAGEVRFLNPLAVNEHAEPGFDLADIEMSAHTIDTLEKLLTNESPADIRELTRRLFKKTKAPAGAPLQPELTEQGEPTKPTKGKTSFYKIPHSGGFAHTDLGNAKRFIHQHGANLLYVRSEKNWYLWNGKIWEPDRTGVVVQLAGKTAESIVQGAEGLTGEEASYIVRHAARSSAAPRIDAMLRIAQSERSASFEEFDADPWLINCQNGVLDLRSGTLKAHAREYKMTKIMETNFDPFATCPLWEKFLERIMEGDKELVDFLRRAVGYSLTASAQEQVLFLLWGHSGSNGKSVFCETLKELWKHYGTQTDSDLVTRDKWGQASASNTVARLKGARLVIANELEEGAVLNESRVKEMTGEDTMSARFLYKEHFEFRPHFKLFLRSNHRPEVHGQDGGIWRRILCIPFRALIKLEEKDKQLREKLKAELPGILTWAMAGCLEWQRTGLGVPQSVIRETEVYRRDMDTFGDWLDECCSLGKDRNGVEYMATSSEIYESYTGWCKKGGERANTKKKLGLVLRERGFLRKRLKGNRWYMGIKVNPERSSLFDSAPDHESPPPLTGADLQQSMGINI